MRVFWLLIAAACGCLTGCVHRNTAATTPAVNTSTDNSYMDLVAGGRVRMVIPLLKPGSSRVTVQPERTAGNTITLAATNLVGYQVAEYFVEGRPHGEVRLRFIAAQVTRDGRTEALTSEPRLPFALPVKVQHVRLIYLIRASESDHNMAIAGSKDMNALVAFTKRFELNPSVCGSATDVFCSWIPPGVAVRPD